MRKLSRSSTELLSNNEGSVITFVAQSFYHSKAHQVVYVNPLDRQKLRRYLNDTSLSNGQCRAGHEQVRGYSRGDLHQKQAKRLQRSRKNTVTKPGHKVRRKMQVEVTDSSSQQRKNPSKQLEKNTAIRSPRKSPKIAKKGVKLYLQNWRKEHGGKRKAKAKTKSSRVAVKSRKRPLQKDIKLQQAREEEKNRQPSASRSLEFGKSVQTAPAEKPAEPCETKGDPGGLKRELQEDEESLSNRSKRRMKTGAESLDSAGGEEKSGPGQEKQELEEWLWSSWEQTTSDVTQDTPESTTQVKPASPTIVSMRSSPKLYPMFTPPVTPSSSRSTPSRRGLHTPKSSGALHTPKGASALHTPETKSPSSWKKLRDKDGMEQMVLDLGQKYFGAVNCDTCGMVYTATHPEDEANHAKFHRKYISCTKFNGWKNEEVMEDYLDGRIIMIGAEAPKYAHKKVEEVRALVDRELGFVEGNSLSGKDLCKTFLFISSDKKIAGCLIAEGITKGYRVIPDKEQPKAEDTDSESQKAWCCETDPSPAVCGVSRIWVAGQMRRKKIASRLMEALRYHYTFGSVLRMEDIAFSDPTPDGKLFATAFSKTPQFLVYKYT